MVKLGQSDERLFGELRDVLESLLKLLCPVTERFAPLDVTLRRLLNEKLCKSDVVTTIAVVGNKGSGKSALLNAVMGRRALPHDTQDALLIVPTPVSEPVLRTPQGKTVALTTEGVRKHLEDEASLKIQELMSRRLHARILEDNEFFAAEWHLMDTPPTTSAICPTLSSVASRIFSPNEFVADVIFYCIDARVLGTDDERHAFDNLVTLDPRERDGDHHMRPGDDVRTRGVTVTPLSTRRRLKECVVFVLTHIDAISDFESCLTNVHRRDEPALKTVQAAYDRFYDLVEDIFDEPVSDNAVLLMNSTGALMSKLMLRKDTTVKVPMGARAAPMPDVPPSIDEMYEYCEAMFGSAFMQTIDEMPEDELRRLVVHHSWSQALVKTGARPLDQMVAVLDFNIVRHMMTSVAVAASEVVDTLHAALVHGSNALATELDSAAAQIDVLQRELDWVQGSVTAVQEAAHAVVDRVESVSDRAMERFCARRLEELKYVVEHRGLEWFMSRQIGIVVDMNSALKRYEAFTVEYLQQRRYLHDKMSRRVDGPVPMSDMSTSNPGSYPDVPGAAGGPGFIDEHLHALLDTMEKEKESQMLTLFARFGHHVRDEFLLFLDDMSVDLVTARDEALSEFVDTCRAPVEQTTQRTGMQLPLDDVTQPLRDIALVEANQRRLNNFLRELPEHVAAAAVEMANDAYQRAAMEADEFDDDADGDDPAARLQRLGKAGLPVPGTDSMAQHLSYVLEAWKLALTTVTVDQLATFRGDELADAVASSSATVVNHLGEYAVSIRDAIEDLDVTVTQLRDDIKVAAEKQEFTKTFVPVLDRLRKQLVEINATDSEDVTHQHTVVRQRPTAGRRRSLDQPNLARRRASTILGSGPLM